MLLLNRTLIMFFIFGLSSSIAYAGNTYKCKGSGPFDSVVWQDVPCRSGEEVSRQNMHDYTKENASKKGHGDFTATQARKLIRLKKGAVGMSKKDIIKSWGLPSKTHVTLTSSGKTETLNYFQLTSSPVVTVNNKGVVSAINYSKSKPPPTKAVKKLGSTFRSSGYSH